MDMKNETDAELIREAVLTRVKDMGSPEFNGTACQVAGMTVSMKEGEDRALAPEGVWSLRFVGKGTPPLDTLTALFRKPEPRTDFVFRNASHMEIPEDPDFKPVERYGMEVYRTFEPEDTGWKVAFLVSEPTQKNAEFGYVNYSDSRGVKTSMTKTRLSFTNPSKALSILAQFGDFITGKMTDDEWGDEYQSGFRDIIGCVQGMLAEKRHPSVVFHTRDTLELYTEEKHKITLRRSLGGGSNAWSLSIEPVAEGGEDKPYSEFVETKRGAGEGGFYLVAGGTFTGRSSFIPVFERVVGRIFLTLWNSKLDRDAARKIFDTLGGVQDKVIGRFQENKPFHEIEGKYIDEED